MGRLLAGHRGAVGAAALRKVVAKYDPAAVDTRSELEDLLVELCDVHGILRPSCNVVVEGWVRDFYWPHARLVVEADSYTYHRSPAALADDRERDVSLTLAGIRSLRFTGEQLRNRARYVVAPSWRHSGRGFHRIAGTRAPRRSSTDRLSAAPCAAPAPCASAAGGRRP